MVPANAESLFSRSVSEDAVPERRTRQLRVRVGVWGRRLVDDVAHVVT